MCHEVRKMYSAFLEIHAFHSDHKLPEYVQKMFNVFNQRKEKVFFFLFFMFLNFLCSKDNIYFLPKIS